jgi:hypothetical protein
MLVTDAHVWVANRSLLLAFAADDALVMTGEWPEKLTRYPAPSFDAPASIGLREATHALAASHAAPLLCLGKKTGVFHDAVTLQKRSGGSLKGHKYELGAVAFAPSGARVFTGGGGAIRPPEVSLRRWDLAGNELGRIERTAGVITALQALDDSVCLARDAREGVAAFDLETSERLWLDAHPHEHRPHGPFALDASSGRAYLAARHPIDPSWTMRVVGARSGAVLAEWPLAPAAALAHVEGVAVAGRWVAVSMGRNAGAPEEQKARVHLIDATTGARGPVLEAEAQTLQLVASRDGRYLACRLGDDLGAAVWDLSRSAPAHA